MILTESEERRIDEIYTQQKEVCTKLPKKLKVSFFFFLRKSLEGKGIGIEDIVKNIKCDEEAFQVSSYYKNICENEANLTKGYLKYLFMKLRIGEVEFKLIF